MNKENMIKLIAHLETLEPSQFDWDKWGDECGTYCCVAGWACMLNGSYHEIYKNRQPPIGTSNILYSEEAMKWLGLNDEQAYLLFYPNHIIYDNPYKLLNNPKLMAKIIYKKMLEWEQEEFNANSTKN